MMGRAMQCSAVQRCPCCRWKEDAEVRRRYVGKRRLEVNGVALSAGMPVEELCLENLRHWQDVR